MFMPLYDGSVERFVGEDCTCSQAVHSQVQRNKCDPNYDPDSQLSQTETPFAWNETGVSVFDAGSIQFSDWIDTQSEEETVSDYDYATTFQYDINLLALRSTDYINGIVSTVPGAVRARRQAASGSQDSNAIPVGAVRSTASCLIAVAAEGSQGDSLKMYVAH